MLTIVMYHYVRDLGRSRYPAIKGLSTERFEGQLDYLTKHYTFCRFDDVIAALRGGPALPCNACLLTFDDGFADHYLTVFPRLDERGITGGFYPPARAIEEHQVLDVHKIHFILASTCDHRKLTEEILRLVGQYRSQYDLASDEELYRQYARAGRYDPAEIVFIKRILQRGLPEAVRAAIVDDLFIRYVSEDEAAFAKELYLDLDQLRCMARHGMEIGGHGYRHIWLEGLPRSEQEREIQGTVRFLTRVYGRPPVDWVMSYPWGSYDRVTVDLVAQAGCRLGVTMSVGLVPNLENPLELERLNTNDFPCSGDAAPCDWTVRMNRSN